MDLCDTISHRLLQVSRAHRAAAGRRLAILGLHAGQEFVLAALWEKDGLRPADVAHQLQLTSQAVTKHIARLAAAGLIEQRPSTTDARSIRLFVTPAGHELRLRVAASIEAVQQHMLDGFTDAEAAQFDTMLQRIANNLGDVA